MNKVIKDIDQALKHYPFLKRVDENGFVRVIGEIVLIHPVKGEFDRYKVSISFPQVYPKCFPQVIETSKKIPRKDYRHVNTDGTLCLAVEPEEKGIVKNGISFTFFLDRVLVPHLSRETFCELNNGYEDGEYSHGIDGFWEYFEGILLTSDRAEILAELEKIIYSKWQKRNEMCYCNSGIKFKRCHLERWNKIMTSGSNYLVNMLELLRKNINT